MIDKMRKINGYFKIETIQDGKVIDTYEDKNTVMARIPELIAAQTSGMGVANIHDYVIHSFALGTGGAKRDANGDLIPLIVSDKRTQMFSEERFWNESRDTSLIPTDDNFKRVHQVTWETPDPAPIDVGTNPSILTTLQGLNEGSTIPKAANTDPNFSEYSYLPVNYRGLYQTEDKDRTKVEISVVGSTVTYIFTVGQFAANNGNDTVEYNEAAMYMRYLSNTSNDPDTGYPLGQLFSMKTFPARPKNNTCALRITWKLYF